MKIRLYTTLLLASLALTSCGTSIRRTALLDTSGPLMSEHYDATVDAYLAQAKRLPSPEREMQLLNAAGLLLQQGMAARSEQLLAQIDEQNLPDLVHNQRQLLQAQLDLQKNKPQQTLADLAAMRNIDTLTRTDRIRYHDLLATTYAKNGNVIESSKERIKLNAMLNERTILDKNAAQLWQTLDNENGTSLEEIVIENTDDNDLSTWVQAVLLAKQAQIDPAKARLQISDWRRAHPQHLANQFLPEIKASVTDLPQNFMAKQIALLLPLNGRLAKQGQSVRDGFMAAYFAGQGQTGPLNIKIYDTSQTDDIRATYTKAVNDGANFIIGPLSKRNVAALARDHKSSIPLLALNFTNSVNDKTNFYQFGLSPQTEAQQVALKAKHDGLKNALVIAPSGSWGQAIANSFSAQWQADGGRVLDSLAFSDKAHLARSIKDLLQIDASQQRSKSIKALLGNSVKFTPRRRQDADMIFLVASPEMARQILPLLRYYYAGKIPVYATSLSYAGNPDRKHDRDLDGVIFCDIPWVVNPEAVGQHPRRYPRLYALGMDAFALSQKLPEFVNQHTTQLSAATGLLTLDSNNTITRRLSFATFVDGAPQPKRSRS